MSTSNVILELLARLRQNRNKRTRIRFSPSIGIEDSVDAGLDTYSSNSPRKKPKFDTLPRDPDDPLAHPLDPDSEAVLESLLRKRARYDDEDMRLDSPDHSPKKSKLDL